MRLGIFAKTFAGRNADTVLTAAAAAGYAAAQYNMACSGLPAMPDTLEVADAQAVAAAAQSAGVAIIAVSGTYNMIHPDPAERAAGHRRLEVLARRCRTLSAPLITLCTGTRHAHDQWTHHPDNSTPQAWRDLLDAMETAIAIADRHEVDLAIEPELANVVNSAAKAQQLLRELASPRVKIILDAANLFEVESLASQRHIVSAAVDLLADHIVMAHAKDRNADGSFATAGKGVLDYDHYLSCLNRAGFAGDLVTHGLSADEASGVARFLGAKLQTLEITAP